MVTEAEAAAQTMKSRVYLAGGFYQRYKELAVQPLLEAGFDVVDPEGLISPPMPGYYVGRDLDLIRRSGIVLAYHDAYPYIYGMAAEMGFAAALGKPIIYVCTARRVDSFLSGLARATFTDLGSAVQFIVERYPEG